MRITRLVNLGIIIVTLFAITNCKDYHEPEFRNGDSHDAKAELVVSPSNQVAVGTSVVFDASASFYSDDRIEWYQDDISIESCHQKDTCIIAMETVGQTIIKIIVKITNVEVLGNEIMEETEDEAVVSITVI